MYDEIKIRGRHYSIVSSSFSIIKYSQIFKRNPILDALFVLDSIEYNKNENSQEVFEILSMMLWSMIYTADTKCISYNRLIQKIRKKNSCLSNVLNLFCSNFETKEKEVENDSNVNLNSKIEKIDFDYVKFIIMIKQIGLTIDDLKHLSYCDIIYYVSEISVKKETVRKASQEDFDNF